MAYKVISKQGQRNTHSDTNTTTVMHPGPRFPHFPTVLPGTALDFCHLSLYKLAQGFASPENAAMSLLLGLLSEFHICMMNGATFEIMLHQHSGLAQLPNQILLQRALSHRDAENTEKLKNKTRYLL
jgi:hypothetical protein